MLSENEIWLKNEEQIKIRKSARKIITLTQKVLQELKYSPSNRVYLNLKINEISNEINEIKEYTQKYKGGKLNENL